MEDIIAPSSPKEKLMSALSSAPFSNADTAPAIAALAHFDLPASRVEAWKYTRTVRISSTVWQPASAEAVVDIEPYTIPSLDAVCVVFVDGIFRADLSQLQQLPNGITISTESHDSLRKSVYSDFFDAYQTAMCTSKIRITVAKKFASEKSLHILHVASTCGSLIQPTIELICNASSQLHVVESFVSCNEGAVFTNRRFNMEVHENASLHVDKIQMETSENFTMNNEEVSVLRDGKFTINTLTVESHWVRNHLHILLEGENTVANLNGFYLPVKKHFVDNHTRVDHHKPHCESNELYKGILNDQSSGVFNGKVFVHPDAQKTNAFQSNANILLSDDAQMNTKPELEIYADDVKCSHGTTTGQLDDSALFYLKSRGLGEDNARKLLANAFVSDVLNKINNEAVRQYVINQLIKRDLLFA